MKNECAFLYLPFLFVALGVLLLTKYFFESTKQTEELLQALNNARIGEAENKEELSEEFQQHTPPGEHLFLNLYVLQRQHAKRGALSTHTLLYSNKRSLLPDWKQFSLIPKRKCRDVHLAKENQSLSSIDCFLPDDPIESSIQIDGNLNHKGELSISTDDRELTLLVIGDIHIHEGLRINVQAETHVLLIAGGDLNVRGIEWEEPNFSLHLHSIRGEILIQEELDAQAFCAAESVVATPRISFYSPRENKLGKKRFSAGYLGCENPSLAFQERRRPLSYQTR